MRVPLRSAAPALALAAVVALLLAGCAGDDEQAAVASGAPATTAGTSAAGPASGDPPTTADPAAVDEVRTLIDAADLNDPATLDALSAMRFEDGAAEAAAQALLDGATGDARWAAVWTYASSGTDPDVLRPVLADQDASLRALAAAALTAWGDPAGIPILGDLVTLPDRLAGSYPPATVGEFATGTLTRFVTGPTVQADATPAERATAWGPWLTQHDPASLVFDHESGLWSAS